MFAGLHRGTILVSPLLLVEVQACLSRKRFDRYLFREERDRCLAALVREGPLVEVSAKSRAIGI